MPSHAARDTATKRGAPSPKPQSLFHSMGQKAGATYGDLGKPNDTVQTNMRSGGARRKGGKSRGLSSTSGYDVKTSVNLGGKGNGPKAKMPKASKAKLVSAK